VQQARADKRRQHSRRSHASSQNAEAASLGEWLEQIADQASAADRISLGDLLHITGRRSFGQVLVLCGLIILAPLVGDTPGVPTAMALVVLAVGLQLLFGRRHVWLPRWLLARSIASGKVKKVVKWLDRPARFVDRFVRPRLDQFVRGVWTSIITLAGLAVALVTPALELIPFSANGAGLVLTALGLALIARDGMLALAALTLTLGGAAVAAMNLL
jgi:hypothetical protein